MKTKKPSSAQLSIAKAYGIPTALACTINMNKCQEYRSWKLSKAGRLQSFLEKLELQQRVYLAKEGSNLST